MKKLLGILVLGLLWCNFANAKIIFRNCKLTPNINASTFFIIDLEKNLKRASATGANVAESMGIGKLSKVKDYTQKIQVKEVLL